MIKYIKYLQKKTNYFLFKKLSSQEYIFSINLDINKIRYFLELKNIKDRRNFLWFGDWDNKKISLNHYRKYSASYNSIYQIYNENINYSQSEEYKLKSKLIEEGKRSGRGNNSSELDSYFMSLDKLKNSLEKLGYKSQKELNTTKKNDEIGVVIGRDWEIIKLQDKFGGTHRFAFCKILNVNPIIVSIKAIHHSLLTKDDMKKILNSMDNEEIKSFLKEKIISNVGK